MADRNGGALRSVLASAEAFSEQAIFLGFFHVKTPSSNAKAWLSRVTLADHFLVEALFDLADIDAATTIRNAPNMRNCDLYVAEGHRISERDRPV